MELTLTPGAWVRNPDRPDWGIGRVQSSIGSRITVNFDEVGKVTVDSRNVRLELVRAADEDSQS
ncbi:MAG: DUF3553 domain-containing protein [Pseudomonadota bacterium]